MVSNDRISLCKVILSLVIVFAVVSLGSCDMLLGDEDDEADGTLTLWIRDAEPHNPCDPGGLNPAPLAVIWVYPAGGLEADEDSWIAYGGWGFGPHPDGSGEIVSRVSIRERGPEADPNLNPEWEGKGGKGYDVYPTVYCVPLNIPGDPDSGPDGDQADLDNPDRIYVGPGNTGWGVPITYTQDGNKTITTQAADFVAPGP